MHAPPFARRRRPFDLRRPRRKRECARRRTAHLFRSRLSPDQNLMDQFRLTLISALVFILLLPLVGFGQPASAKRWYKGNTHAHTLRSDGDSTPEEVAKWYKE